MLSAAGLVPVLALADAAGLSRLAGEHLSVPGDKGANAGLKVASLVAGMVPGADGVDDMALLRHGGMGRVFARAYAPSTLGSFVRSSAFGHVRQLDAVASRFLTDLATHAPQVTGGGTSGPVLVDVDDAPVVRVHRYAKQGAGFGYSKVRGPTPLIATATTTSSAPIVVAQRLRQGSCGSPRGAKRLLADALKPSTSSSVPVAPASRCCGRTRRSTGHPRSVPRCAVGPMYRHRAPGPRGKGRDHHHQGPRVDTDRVHRRRLRRVHWDMGASGRASLGEMRPSLATWAASPAYPPKTLDQLESRKARPAAGHRRAVADRAILQPAAPSACPSPFGERPPDVRRRWLGSPYAPVRRGFAAVGSSCSLS